MSNRALSNIITIWLTIFMSAIVGLIVYQKSYQEPDTSCVEKSVEFYATCMAADSPYLAQLDDCESSRRHFVLECREESGE